MNKNRLVRGLAVAAATLTGLGLFFLCLSTVSAQAPGSAPVEPATAQIWHVDNSPGEGLVGYWKFDQVTNSTTINSALLTNTATFSNGVALSAIALPPLLGIPNFSKLSLNGTNQFLLVPDAAQLDVAPDHFSVAAWVRRVEQALNIH